MSKYQPRNLLNKGKFITSFFAFSLVIILDQLSKFWVQYFLPKMCYFCSYPYGGIGIFKNILGVEFSIVHATNKGAAWSLFSDHQELLMIIRIFLIVFLAFYAVRYIKEGAQILPFAFLIAGAFSNAIDYFTYGHVVDMLHFIFFGYDYPVFNIADASIFIAVALMALSYLQEIKSTRRERGA